jgi:hypothetical protein
VARGWESKSIEAQQDERLTASTATGPRSAEERERLARRQVIELSLARAEADRVAAASPAHVAMLDQAIATLRDQLRQLQ